MPCAGASHGLFDQPFGGDVQLHVLGLADMGEPAEGLLSGAAHLLRMMPIA